MWLVAAYAGGNSGLQPLGLIQGAGQDGLPVAEQGTRKQQDAFIGIEIMVDRYGAQRDLWNKIEDIGQGISAPAMPPKTVTRV